jgi:hypothetical protein
MFFNISFDFFTNYTTLLQLVGTDDTTNTLDERRDEAAAAATNSHHCHTQRVTSDDSEQHTTRQMTCPQPLVCVFFFKFLLSLSLITLLYYN